MSYSITYTGNGYEIKEKEKEMERNCISCKYKNLNFSQFPCYACDHGSHFKPKGNYIDEDTKAVLNSIYGAASIKADFSTLYMQFHLDKYIKNVIFNDPATIVFWTDNTKTVVKCQEGDVYDPEKGLAMAICKKAMGNKGAYCNVFKKWVPEEVEANDACLRWIGDSLAEGVQKAIGRFNSITEEKEKRKVLRDNLMVTAATRAVYMEADMDLVVLPTGVEGEAELAKFIAERVDDYIRMDVQTPFDIFIEEALKIKYGVKKNDEILLCDSCRYENLTDDSSTCRHCNNNENYEPKVCTTPLVEVKNND